MKIIKKLLFSLKEKISLYRNIAKTIDLAKTAIKENEKIKKENSAMKQRLRDMDMRALNKTYEGFKVTEINENTSVVWVTASDPELITGNNFSQIRNVIQKAAPHLDCIIATRHADIKLFNKEEIKALKKALNESN